MAGGRFCEMGKSPRRDRNKLSTNERFGLFIQICRAIQHAHQKGMRDVKPSNLLVTMHDGPSIGIQSDLSSPFGSTPSLFIPIQSVSDGIVHGNSSLFPARQKLGAGRLSMNAIAHGTCLLSKSLITYSGGHL